jgi:hypothetical protein
VTSISQTDLRSIIIIAPKKCTKMFFDILLFTIATFHVPDATLRSTSASRHPCGNRGREEIITYSLVDNQSESPLDHLFYTILKKWLNYGFEMERKGEMVRDG